jgi:hypothetical protein
VVSQQYGKRALDKFHEVKAVLGYEATRLSPIPNLHFDGLRAV